MALSTGTSSSASFAPAETPAHGWIHEVFLSFRGVDTRQGITSAIYDGLQNRRGIKTFMDSQKLEVGDSISPTLLTAIKESRFAVVVLSHHYADSTWCLEELATIFQCMKDKKRVLPLFYQVDPSDVRYQKGSFGDAFTKHESRHGIEKVKLWKDALRNVANLSGWDSNNFLSDKELVEDIVKLVCSKVIQVRIDTSRDFEVFEATKLAMHKVMESLQDDEIAVIGLYGIGGIGKTTLVKHAGALARANGIFNKVVMAVVSQSVVLKQIQDQLADMLALKFNEDTEEKGRAIILQETILRENKLLIILDDMWKILPLSSIGIPNNEELQGCNSKVLFTTRIRKLCQEMLSDVEINLSILSEEDSLKFFSKKVRTDFHESTELHSVAREVARRCVGVPVALAAVARELQDKDLDEWKKAAERLHGSQSANPEDENHVFNCIKLCHESTDAMSFLLFCCLFPEDYDIPIEDLFRYGIGKGLFQKSNTLQEARATADLVVKSLKAYDLLLDSEKRGCVKMRDVIRDVVRSISSSEDGQHMFVYSGLGLTEWPRINADIDYSAISLMDNNIISIPKELICSKLLQILSLRNSFTYKWEITFSETFFQSQKELRVLDLRQNQHLELSRTFSMLTNLRALFITCYVTGVEELCNLGKLEILSYTSALFFPKELGELSKLRMLDISNNDYMFPPQVISRLINLEELYMKGKFLWGCKDHKEYKGNQTDLCCKEFLGLPKLNVLEVQIHDVGCLPKVVEFNPHWVKFDIIFNANQSVEYLAELPQHESRKFLCLDTTIINLPDWFHKVVTERAEKLVYYWFRDMNNILVEYGTGRFDGVKSLALIRYDDDFEWRELLNTLTWEVSDKPMFDNLEEMHVEEVPCVELCVGELPIGSFCNLKKLRVHDCSNMENALLSSNLLKRLQNLEELICGDMSGIEYVFETEGMEQEQSIFTSLRKIHLSRLSKLKDICNGPAPAHAIFQNLTSLKVGHCPALKYVFPSTCVAHGLVQLEELYVYECPNVEAVIEASEEADNKDMIEFPGLKILYLVRLKKLTRFYGTSGSCHPIINCFSLEWICCYGSGKFDYACNLSTLPSLKKFQESRNLIHEATRDKLLPRGSKRFLPSGSRTTRNKRLLPVSLKEFQVNKNYCYHMTRNRLDEESKARRSVDSYSFDSNPELDDLFKSEFMKNAINKGFLFNPERMTDQDTL